MSTRLYSGAALAGTCSVLRDTSALLDPAANSQSDRSVSNSPAPFHLIGERLLRAATISARREPAAAAAEVFREGIKAHPAKPALHNGLGAAVLAVARFAPHADASKLLAEAAREFQAALDEAEDQRVPRAAHLRYSVNLATVQWLRGERSGDAALITEAAEKLRALATELSEASPHWAHVQDNLGNALAALGRYAEAIDAFGAALRGHQSGLERARTLNNLGTAHAGRRRYGKACKCYRESLQLLSREQTPLAWGLAQHNLATASLQSVLSGPRPERAGARLVEAVDAFRAALEVRSRAQVPFEWALTAANMAGALLSLGAQASLANGDSEHQAGLCHVREAVGLYHDALSELAGADLERTARNLLVALQVLERLSADHATRDEIRVRRAELLLFAKREGLGGIADDIGEIPEPFIAPQPPAALDRDWPIDTYAQAHKELGENIVQYLSRVWSPLIRAGAIDLRTLRQCDPSAAKAIDNFRQRRDPATGMRRTLPPGLDIPTKREVNDRLAAAIARAGDRPARLDWALRARTRRERSKEKV